MGLWILLPGDHSKARKREREIEKPDEKSREVKGWEREKSDEKSWKVKGWEKT